MPHKNSRSCATHNGNFHADEITACALLICTDCIDIDKISRTRDAQSIDKAEFVVDVGGKYEPQAKRFDHHQIKYTGLLSSAGMVLRYLGELQKLSPEQQHLLGDNLVSGVDDHDNGRAPPLRGICTFSHLISNFMPMEYEASDEKIDRQFFQALEFAVGHIRRLLDRYRIVMQSKDEVVRAMSIGKHFLVFDRALSWIENFFAQGGQRHPALFVIMPTGEHWKLRAIPKILDHKMDLRVPLPANWAGRMNADLQRISGVDGAIFCHKGRFISVWKTKEEALIAGRIALRQAGIASVDG